MENETMNTYTEPQKLDLVTQAMQVIENAVRLAVEKGNDTDLPVALAMLELINPNNHSKGE
jgi:hypothetical protein